MDLNKQLLFNFLDMATRHIDDLVGGKLEHEHDKLERMRLTARYAHFNDTVRTWMEVIKENEQQ